MKFKKFCAKCGKSFIGDKNEKYCTACKFEMTLQKKNNSAEISKQQEVLNYVRDRQMSNESRSVSAQEVMEKVGVTKEFINSMIRAEFFGSSFKTGEKYPHPCEKCGKIIFEGVYCENCLKELRAMLKKEGEEREIKKQLLIEMEAQRKNNNVILIVDENRYFAEKTRQILQEKFQNYNILIANDVEHTINFSHGLKVKLILIDDAINLRFNGLKILNKIREDYVISDMPVIVTTNKFDEEKKSAAFKLDARDYIEKPFDAENLTDRVSKILFSDVEFINPMHKILLIDDNADDAEIEKNILEKNFHCTVFTVESGIEGLEILQKVENISLICISLQMSFMNGFRVLELIRQNEFFKSIPAIFMINAEDSETIRRIKKSPAVGCINKPEISAGYFTFLKKYLPKEKKL
ncbi:MAG: response regulator [Selenomonadaceae bacterium]|nr:response regulator [Selenomonadaceae bacterium]